jgi:hypothetical protein
MPAIPSSIVVLSLTSGSVIVKSNLVYSNTYLTSTSLQDYVSSRLSSAASSSTSSSFPVYSDSIGVTSVTNCKPFY